MITPAHVLSARGVTGFVGIPEIINHSSATVLVGWTRREIVSSPHIGTTVRSYFLGKAVHANQYMCILLVLMFSLASKLLRWIILVCCWQEFGCSIPWHGFWLGYVKIVCGVPTSSPDPNSAMLIDCKHKGDPVDLCDGIWFSSFPLELLLSRKDSLHCKHPFFS